MREKNDGRTRNLDKISIFLEDYQKGYMIYKDGMLWRTVKKFGAGRNRDGFIIKQLKEPEPMGNLNKENRYYRMNKRVDGILYTVYMHHIIYAIHYGIDELAKYEVIDHIDGDRGNNRIENLEGVTVEENNRRIIELDMLRPPRGEENGASVLTEPDVLKIRDLYSRKEYNQYQLADMFEVSQGQISEIINRNRWAHI